MEDPRVCLVQTAAESTLSARVTTCQFTKRKHEANANTTCDLFVGDFVTDAWRWILWLFMPVHIHYSIESCPLMAAF